MALNYHLRIDRLTQNAGTGSPEVGVDPAAFDRSQFLNLYVTGVIPGGRTVKLGYRELTDPAPEGADPETIDVEQAASGEADADGSCKLQLQHFSLFERKKYLLFVYDDVQDRRAMASHEIITKKDY